MILPFSEKARQAAQSSTEFSLDSNTVEASVLYIGQVLRKQVKEADADALDIKKLAVCKAILSLCPYPLIARFSDYYSKLWAKFFMQNKTAALGFGREIFPTMQIQGSDFKVNVFEYLNAEESPSFANLSKGVVSLDESELNDVLARQVKRRVMSIPNQPVFPEEVKQAAMQLSKEFALSIPRGSKHLEKEEIKQIRLGIAEGGRYYGCMKLSRACFNDGLSFEEAKQVIEEFVKSCPPSKNPFTEKEALTCLEWLYRKGTKGSQAGLFNHGNLGEIHA